MNESRTQQVLRCFSLVESEAPVDLKITDFQVQDTLNTPTEDIAKNVSDKLIQFVVDQDHVYSLYDSIFKSDDDSLLISFFPSILDIVEETTSFISQLDDVSYIQWSRVLPTDSEFDEDVEYFVVAKVFLNIESTVSLSVVQNSLPDELIPTTDTQDFTVPPLDVSGSKVSSRSSVLAAMRKIIEVQ